MKELDMYRLMLAGMGTKVEDDADRATIRALTAAFDLLESVDALATSINEKNAAEMADLFERIVDEVKAFREKVPHESV